jgi:ribosome-associated translation inhibitor RaiA
MNFSHGSNSDVSNGSKISAENDPELKAFIYQHLVDLQPYLAAESQIAVLVQAEPEFEPEDGMPREESLTLVATLGDYRLEAEGQAENLYEAFLDAKRKMLTQLEEWYLSAIDSSERDNEIQAVIEGRYMIH